jgi:hypothetical protein
MTAPSIKQSAYGNGAVLTSLTTIGNYIVAVSPSFSTTKGVTDTAGNTYTWLCGTSDINANYCDIYVAPVTVATSGNTVKATNNIWPLFVSEIQNTTGLDGTATATAFNFSGAGTASSSITTTSVNSLLIGGIVDQNSMSTITPAGGATLINSNTGNADFSAASFLVVTTGANSIQWTIPGANTGVVVVVAFAGSGITKTPYNNSMLWMWQ